MVSAHRSALLLVLAAAGACHQGTYGVEPLAAPGRPAFSSREIASTAPAGVDLPCADCDASPLSPELARVVEDRLADLRARGGSCARYGSVLEASYRRGRITIRPYMWRVGSQLASGEAKPNGDMTLAREIDSLNVGVRTVDEVVWSMEHEAVHIAFDIASGNDLGEARANYYVRECRG